MDDFICENVPGYTAKNFNKDDIDFDYMKKFPNYDFIKGNEKGVIIVNTERWNELTIEAKGRRALHEYMGITKLEIGDYKLSNLVKISTNQSRSEKITLQEKMICNITLEKSSFINGDNVSQTQKISGTCGDVKANFAIFSEVGPYIINYIIDCGYLELVTYKKDTINLTPFNLGHTIDEIFPARKYVQGETDYLTEIKNNDLTLTIQCSSY